MVRLRVLALLGVVLSAARCAHSRPPEEAPKWEPAQPPDAAYALSHLTTIDARLAARSGRPFGPETNTISSYARPLHDPYLFADRRERLVGLRAMLPPEVSVADHTGEPALTKQLIEEELARIEDESDDLARSSVDMLGLLLASRDSDDWISFRLGELRDALVKKGLSVFERTELLQIVHAAPPTEEGTRTREALRRLRDMLENAHAVALPLLERSMFRQRLEFQARAMMSPDAIAPAIERARFTLRVQLDAAFSVLGPRRGAAVRARAVTLLSDPAGCAPRVPARTAADLGPPVERAHACGLARALADAWSDEQEVAALLAMYEALGTACRAIALHDLRRDIAGTDALCPRYANLVVRDGADDAQMRIAANHPVSAVVTGLAIHLLVRDGAAHATARAGRWMRFGDAPLHVLELVLSGGSG